MISFKNTESEKHTYKITKILEKYNSKLKIKAKTLKK